MLQRSDWIPGSFDDLNSSSTETIVKNKHTESFTNVSKENPNRIETIVTSQKNQPNWCFFLRPILFGLFIGSLLASIGLAIAVTIWLTPVKSLSTKLSSSTFSTLRTTTVNRTTVSTIFTNSTGIVTTSTTSRTSSTSSTTSSTSSTTSTTSRTSSTSSTTSSTSSTTSTTSRTSSTSSTTSSISSTTSTTSSTTTSTSSTTTSTSMNLSITTTTTTTSPPNLLINPGAENGTLTPWIQTGSGLVEIDDGSIIPGYNPYSGTKQFYGGYISSGSFNSISQSVILLNGTQGFTAAQLDNGTLRAYISFFQQSYYQLLGTDDINIRLDFRTSNLTLISSVTTSYISCTSSWCFNSANYLIPKGTRRIDYVINFWIITGSYIDAYVDDNSLRVY